MDNNRTIILKSGKTLTKSDFDYLESKKQLTTPNETSQVWERFFKIENAEYAICKLCYQVYTYNSKSTGTSSLIAHKCDLKNKTPSILTHIASSEISKQNKKKLNDIIFQFLLDSWLPLRLVETNGFKKFIGSITSLSFRNNIIINDQAILHRTSFSNMIPPYYQEQKQKFI